MATAVQVQYRRGTASQVTAFAGAAGEMVVDTTNNRVVVQDGGTAGGWPAAKLADVGRISFVLKAVNFNAANTDNQISVAVPQGFSRYRVVELYISGASQSLTTATCGLFTATGAGGTAIVTGGTAITVSTASENTTNNMQSFTINNTGTQSFTDTILYFRVQTAEGAAATANVTLLIAPLS
jgi:hypothetical protein